MTECRYLACGRAAEVAGRCRACCQHLRRTGRERGPDVIHASARRRLMIDQRHHREHELATVGVVEQYADPRY